MVKSSRSIRSTATGDRCAVNTGGRRSTPSSSPAAQADEQRGRSPGELDGVERLPPVFTAHRSPVAVERIDREDFTMNHEPALIVRVASEWFGLDRVGKLEIVCADAETAVTGLAQAGRQFDNVMDDVSYADEPEVALPKLLAVVPLVTPRGSLVVNRHRRGDPRPLARTLRLYFREVRLRRVRRTGENTLICCSRPLLSPPGGA